MNKRLWILLLVAIFTACGSVKPVIQPFSTPESQCLPKLFERNNYYTGKLLNVKDFEQEQQYFNQKRYLQNRYVQGFGVVCGLLVLPAEQGRDLVKITPGFALDCKGREIILPETKYLDLAVYRGDMYISIAYEEVEVDPVPNPGTEKSGEQYSKIQERCKIDVLEQLPAGYLSTYDLLQLRKKQDIMKWIIDNHEICCSDDRPVVLAKVSHHRRGLTAEQVDNFSFRRFVLTMDDLLPFLRIK